MWKYVQYRKFILGFFAENYVEYVPTADKSKVDNKIYYRLLEMPTEETEGDITTQYSRYIADSSDFYYDTNNKCSVYSGVSAEELELKTVYEPIVQKRIKINLDQLHFLYDFDLNGFNQDWYLIYKDNDNTIQFFNKDQYSTRIYINTGYEDGLNAENLDQLPYLDVKDTVQPIVLYDLVEVTDLYFSFGVICSLSYNTITKTYRFEDDGEIKIEEDGKRKTVKIKDLKQNYLNAIAQYQQLVDEYSDSDLTQEDPTEAIYEEQNIVDYIEEAHNKYMQALSIYIKNWKEENQVNEY